MQTFWKVGVGYGAVSESEKILIRSLISKNTEPNYLIFLVKSYVMAMK